MKTHPRCFLVGAVLLCGTAFAETTIEESATPDVSARNEIKATDFAHAKSPAPTIHSESVTLAKTGDAAAPASTLGLTDPEEAAPVQMPAYQVHDLPDHTVRELRESVAVRELLAPCVIFRKDVSGTKEVQALSAPVWPIQGEQGTQRLQARFPLLSLAW